MGAITTQHKIGSGFGAQSTAAEALRGIDLSGRLAIVTGGYSGVGLETARALAGAGSHVIVPARRRDVAAAALEGIEPWRSIGWTSRTWRPFVRSPIASSPAAAGSRSSSTTPG